MGMSTHVVGFRPADEEWKQMKAVWDACIIAKIDPPIKVLEFFNDEYPGDNPGREVELGDAIRPWEDSYRQGFELDVKLIPSGVRYLRFYNSW